VLASLLHAVKVLFHLTAMAGKPGERHVYDAQAALATLQTNAASLSQADPVQHRPLLAFSHVCTAIYALSLQDCQAACVHTAAADAVLAETNSQGGAL
jgi:hypothetical protein